MRASKVSLWVAALGLAACSSPPETAKQPPPPADITVTVTSPAPGAELVAGARPAIVVSGTVATSDPSQGALEAWVNGVRADVKDGAFTAEVTAEPGINHIKVEGGDGITDLVGRELDVLWVPEYMAPLEGQTGFDIASALELRLGQRFFDGRLLGSALDLSTNPVVARDVAAALELILRHVDLANLLPPGGLQIGQSGASLTVEIPSVTPANLVVDARIVDSPAPALALTIDLLGVALGMRGNFTLNTTTLVVEGGVTADLHATARLTLTTGEDGAIRVGVTDIAATVGQLVPGFTGRDGAELSALLAITSSQFHGLIEGLLRTQLIPTFTEQLPPFLEQLLGATDQLLDNVNFTLDPGLGAPVTLQLDGRMAALAVVPGATSGHVTVREDLMVRTTGAPIHPASRGAPRLDVSSGEPALSGAGVHLTMRVDFLNALLHALWNAGMLEGTLMSGGLAAKVSAKLPPVIRPTPASSPCKIDGERCDIQLQLGQIEAQLLGQNFGLNASAGARIEVDGSTVSLKIQMKPDLTVWTIGPGSLAPDTVSTLIADLVWPMLFGALGENLKIQLPLPDLATLGLADLAPELADAELLLQMRQRPSFSAGRMVLGADLTLATPPP
jgi:hypothetical protein